MARKLHTLVVPTLLLLSLPAHADTRAPTLMPGNMPALSQGRGSDASTRFAPAPMPNPDALAPTSGQGGNQVLVSPGLTQTPTGRGFGGDGFAPGSAYSGTLERRARGGTGLGSTIAPSLNLKVPVEVGVR